MDQDPGSTQLPVLKPTEHVNVLQYNTYEGMETAGAAGLVYAATTSLRSLPPKKNFAHAWDLAVPVLKEAPLSAAAYGNTKAVLEDGTILQMDEELAAKVSIMVKDMLMHICMQNDLKIHHTKFKDNPLHEIDIAAMLKTETTRKPSDPLDAMSVSMRKSLTFAI
ncbi:uncharacterized protein RCC_07627 [Ramularia collo-cygni]|uniref:Uncharacterized protein n=1 Tax=Ramularia collo-cygni TaxID=112498 RepID=A0A2D3UVK5_9PEZI|nr:uncharacterized protein RCC_07627 [Ramularia collo-cygni]CZT21762.1 uncharacterized protein RCC_07627 [Ramularia collo-cygni]